VAIAWTGLAIGAWTLYLAAAAVLAAVVFESYPRIRPPE